MAIYKFSKEGAEDLRRLAKSLLLYAKHILEQSVCLKQKTASLEGALGIYGEQILELVEKNTRTLEVHMEGIMDLAGMLSEKAKKIEECVSNGMGISAVQASRGMAAASSGHFVSKKPQGKSMTEEQRQALDNYMGTSHASINQFLELQNNKPWSDSQRNRLERMVKHLTECIDTHGSLQKGILYRGMNAKEIFGSDLGSLTPDGIIRKYSGKEQMSRRFLSTSYQRETAQSYANQYNGAVVRIRVPEGTKGLYLGGEEQEVLLQRGMEYKIDKVSYDGFTYDVQITLLSQEGIGKGGKTSISRTSTVAGGIRPRNLSVSQHTMTCGSDGNMVYDAPLETDRDLWKKQGKSRVSFQGTCGLCCCVNVLRLAGIPATEGQMINYASHTQDLGKAEMLCEKGHLNPYKNGATSAENRKAILEHFGIGSSLLAVEMGSDGLPSEKNIEVIADLVRSGRGVIISVHAKMLWYHIPYRTNDCHAVTVTSVKEDPGGKVLGFYICDSAKGGTKFYPAEQIMRALTGAEINATSQIIR